MDFTVLGELISNIGYPIVIGFVLLYFLKDQSDSHAKEMAGMRESLDNNTNAITRLCAMMEEKND